MAFAHFEHAPAGFADTADVIFEVEGQRLPAHSQILAYHSCFIHNMLEDLGESGARQKHSQLDPLIIPAALLSSCTAQDVQAFLCQIYDFGNRQLPCGEQTYQLLKIADRFNAPRLLKRCKDDLLARVPELFTPAGLFLATQKPGAVGWALRAEQFGLEDLRKKAVAFIAQNYEALRRDERLKQLTVASLLQLADELHLLRQAEVFPAFKKARTHWG